MKIVSISKVDWDDDAEESIGLDIEYEKSLLFGECFKRKLLKILLKETKCNLVLQDKNTYSVVPPIVLDYHPDDFGKVEKLLYTKYFNYNPTFEEYFNMVVDSLSQFKNPNSNYLDTDLRQFNEKIYVDLRPLMDALQERGLKLEVVGCEDFKRRIKGVNRYCRLSNNSTSRLLNIGPYSDGIRFDE